MQLPGLLIKSLRGLKGFDELPFTEVHVSGGQVTSVRLNPGKIVKHYNFNPEGAVPWCEHGYYLAERPSFTADPLFHAGAYYVQEASSMFLETVFCQLVGSREGLRVLDLCAAPGGKSTHLQMLVSTNSLLVSNEVIKPRASVLAENIAKWGATNVVVTNNDPRDFERLPEYFDVIVADAPCSGSGLFRREPEAVREWSLSNVQLCSQRQQRILADVLPALKEGGILIYSTCSYSIEEDEEILDWLVSEMQMECLQVKPAPEWKVIESLSPAGKAYGYRFYPDKVRGEGFFIAALRKAGRTKSRDAVSMQKKRLQRLPVTSKEKGCLFPFLKNAEKFIYIRQQEDILALPECLAEDIILLQSALYIRKAGVRMGTIVRDELLPHHELALSQYVNHELPVIDVEIAEALNYLRKAGIVLDTHLRGWVLITYKNVPLGWIKILANRINNYYPKEWRILNK